MLLPLLMAVQCHTGDLLPHSSKQERGRKVPTCFLVHCRTVIGEPLWSARTRMVIPVRGLLTATSPSLPPDKIISPAARGGKGTRHVL